MKVNIKRVEPTMLTFAMLEEGELFGFRENPIILLVLAPAARNGKGNCVVISPSGNDGSTHAGSTISVPSDREVVRVVQADFTLQN